MFYWGDFKRKVAQKVHRLITLLCNGITQYRKIHYSFTQTVI